jgi:hypothetical protein
MGDAGRWQGAASIRLRPGSDYLHTAGHCCALQAFVVAPASRSDKRRLMAIVSAATIALAVTALVFVATGSVSVLPRGKQCTMKRLGRKKAACVCDHVHGWGTAQVRVR